jgi:hypothetical protein
MTVETESLDKGLIDFSLALQYIKMGMKVKRVGWNGKGAFVFLVPGSTFVVNRAPLLGIFPEGTEVNYLPHVDMKTAAGKITSWVPSQADLMASDWQVL